MTYQERKLREELRWLCARYDNGAMSEATFASLKEIECDIAWMDHEQERRRAS
jgi:hypothetical protein